MAEPRSIVIIGSGLGGLATGLFLSKEGYEVTVLESNRQIGGNLQVFARDKHAFDASVHYIGGMGPGQNLYKIFKYLGIVDALNLEKLDEDAFDKIVFFDDPKTVYPLAQGYENFIRQLSGMFPDETDNIRRYCEMLSGVCDRFPLYSIRAGSPSQKFEVMSSDTQAVIAGITPNKRLQQVLAGNNMLYAGEGDRTPFYVHALIQNSYIEGSYRFIKGGSNLAKQLARKIMEHGGKIKIRSHVTRLHVEGGTVAFAETAKGDRYYADAFISNTHPAQTVAMTDSSAFWPAYRNRMQDLENTVSTFILNITLKPGRIPYERSNYYCILNDDVWKAIYHDEASWPNMFAIYFSPSDGDAEFAEGITLLTYMNYEEMRAWHPTHNTVTEPGVRGPGYEAFKNEKAEKLIALADKIIPGLREATINYYAATPLTFRDYLGNGDGSLYGISKDYKDIFKSMVSHRTRIPNLYLTGQNLNLHGVLGVTISSIITASAFVDLETLIRKIDDAQNT